MHQELSIIYLVNNDFNKTDNSKIEISAHRFCTLFFPKVEVYAVWTRGKVFTEKTSLMHKTLVFNCLVTSHKFAHHAKHFHGGGVEVISLTLFTGRCPTVSFIAAYTAMNWGRPTG